MNIGSAIQGMTERLTNFMETVLIKVLGTLVPLWLLNLFSLKFVQFHINAVFFHKNNQNKVFFLKRRKSEKNFSFISKEKF